MRYDVIVLGGGPAGCAAASRLNDNQVHVAVVDQSIQEKRKIGESISGSARPLLNKLNLLEMLEGGAHLRSCGGSSSWGSPRLEYKDSLYDPHGVGWHLDRKRFDRDLREQLTGSGVAIFENAIQQIVRTDKGWTVKLANETLKAGLLIDATGRSALVARAEGVKRVVDDHMVSLYTWTNSDSQDSDTRIMIEATAQGWWYSSKLPGQTRVLAFHSDADHSLPKDEYFSQALESTLHIKALLGVGTKLSSIYKKPASGSTLTEWAGVGWLACGDAAMTFDPLAAQGIFNALFTGDFAAQTVLKLLAGETNAFLEYHDQLEKIRKTYLRQHSLFYALETRWPEEKFWRRRWPLGSNVNSLAP